MSKKISLFNETVNALKAHGKTLEDVIWVGGDDFEIINWQAALHVTYYDGYGGQEIATDLKVVGADFWLERHEYDGSEWWEYKSLPTRPTKKRDTAKVYNGSDNWATVEEMTREGGKYGY